MRMPDALTRMRATDPAGNSTHRSPQQCPRTIKSALYACIAAWRAHTPALAHTHTYARTHAHTHTRTLTHTYTRAVSGRVAAHPWHTTHWYSRGTLGVPPQGVAFSRTPHAPTRMHAADRACNSTHKTPQHCPRTIKSALCACIAAWCARAPARTHTHTLTHTHAHTHARLHTLTHTYTRAVSCVAGLLIRGTRPMGTRGVL